MESALNVHFAICNLQFAVCNRSRLSWKLNMAGPAAPAPS
jgi:hypothetical protein